MVGLKAAHEYVTSLSEYHQQIVALPPTESVHVMRDTEITVLYEQIESLNPEKKKARVKEDTSKLDADIADLHQRKQLLVAEREREQKRVEYENENTQLKERFEMLEAENVKLKKYIERLEKDKEAEMSEQAEMLQKTAELKQIVQTYLQRGEQEEQDSAKEGDNEMGTQAVPQKKLQVKLESSLYPIPLVLLCAT